MESPSIVVKNVYNFLREREKGNNKNNTWFCCLEEDEIEPSLSDEETARGKKRNFELGLRRNRNRVVVLFLVHFGCKT